MLYCMHDNAEESAMGSDAPANIGGRTELFVDDCLIAGAEDARLRGRPVRLVIELKDADLYAMEFGGTL